MSDIEVRPFTENDAINVCDWIYNNSLEIYNLPSWNEAISKNYSFTKEDVRNKEFLSFYIKDQLMGYGRLIIKNKEVVLGIGMKPDLCGQGLGTKAFQLLIAEAKKRYGDCGQTLLVRKFNKRAIRCYQNCGFIVLKEVKIMTRQGIDDIFLKMILKGEY